MLPTCTRLTSGEAALQVGRHQSKVSRVETGARGVGPADVRLLLDAYETRGGQPPALLLRLAGALFSADSWIRSLTTA